MNRLVLILLMITAQCYAGPWPVPTGFVPGEPNDYEDIPLHYNWGLVEAGPATDLPQPKYKYILRAGVIKTSCWYCPYLEFSMNQSMPVGTHGNTMSDAALALIRDLRPGSLYVNYTYPIQHDPHACVGVFGVPWDKVLESGGGRGTTDLSDIISPPGTCLRTPPVLNWCSLDSANLVLDHGVVTGPSVSLATTRLSVVCGTDTRVRLGLLGASSSTIGIGGGTSRLSTQYGPLGSVINLPGGRSDLTVTSTLQGVSSGAWEQSAVLVLQPE